MEAIICTVTEDGKQFHPEVPHALNAWLTEQARLIGSPDIVEFRTRSLESLLATTEQKASARSGYPWAVSLSAPDGQRLVLAPQATQDIFQSVAEFAAWAETRNG